MRMLSGWWVRLALASGVGVTQLIACSSHTGNSNEEKASGKLSLALESTAPSGKTYRLRNAVFQITDSRDGSFVATLSSEDSPASVAELHTVLLTGNYSVQLLDGWFLERLDGGGGFGGGPGSGGFGGGFPQAGTGGFSGSGFGGASGGDVGEGGEAPNIENLPVGLAGTAGKPTTGGSGGSFMMGSAGTVAIGGSPSFGGSQSVGGSPTFGGSKSIGGDGGGGPIDPTGGTRVEATLQSSPFQFFSLFGGDDAFVSFRFKVGKDIIDFTRGKLHINIDITEEGCQPPPGVLDPQRVLIETHVDALSGLTLNGVFSAIATNGGRNDDPSLIYNEIIDSYSSAANARLPNAIHCGDQTTNGQPSLNGYPIECDRVEVNHFDGQAKFFPTAFVNRIDLAPENGAHCGQQRVIFASNQQNRMFMIFEAQIPNPHPELGIDGCRPLAQFWLDANGMSDAGQRGQRLSEAFLNGAPELAQAGFGPFLSATNFTVGSGQIRTNQFDQDPWTLREFKLAVGNGNLVAVPFPTAESPNGALWNEANNMPQGAACRQNFLSAIDGLLDNDPAKMSFIVDDACKDAESRNDNTENYGAQLSPGFRSQLEDKLAGSGLSATDIANRAQFAGSCIGCHDAANGASLGLGVFAPFSNGFVHVQEFPQQCSTNDPALCFQASPAMKNVFFPTRMQAMGKVLSIPIIPNPCDDGGGSGGSGGFGGGGFGGSGFAGGFGEAGAVGEGGFASGGKSSGGGAVPPSAEPTPAPVIHLSLPSASLPVAELQKRDSKIRDQYGEKTLSGKSAHSTH